MDLRKHLGINYDFKRNNNKNDMYVLCTTEAKVDDIVKSYEEFIDGDVKIYASRGVSNSVLGNNPGEVLHINQYRSLVGKIIFFRQRLDRRCAIK